MLDSPDVGRYREEQRQTKTEIQCTDIIRRYIMANDLQDANKLQRFTTWPLSSLVD